MPSKANGNNLFGKGLPGVHVPVALLGARREFERRDDRALEDWRAAARNDTARFPVEGFEHATVALRCVQLD